MALSPAGQQAGAGAPTGEVRHVSPLGQLPEVQTPPQPSGAPHAALAHFGVQPVVPPLELEPPVVPPPVEPVEAPLEPALPVEPPLVVAPADEDVPLPDEPWPPVVPLLACPPVVLPDEDVALPPDEPAVPLEPLVHDGPPQLFVRPLQVYPEGQGALSEQLFPQ